MQEMLNGQNKTSIENDLKSGPSVWYQKTEVIKNSGIYVEPRALDNDMKTFISSYGLEPEDFFGKRVLDVGAFSGAMSFYAEDCGAEVVAIDIQHPSTNGFKVIHDIRCSTVTHVMASVYDLHPDLFGVFDIIIFFGVFYHFKHPLLALERINMVTKKGGKLIAQGTSADYYLHFPDKINVGINLSEISKETNNLNELPLLGFYKNTFLDDVTNWFIPNTRAISDMISTVGFDVLQEETCPMFFKDLHLSFARIKAVKVSEPKPEYPLDFYSHVRKFTESEVLTTSFMIPTYYEVERARAERATIQSHKFIPRNSYNNMVLTRLFRFMMRAIKSVLRFCLPYGLVRYIQRKRHEQ
jgi:SAM-dependent methyltransferase